MNSYPKYVEVHGIKYPINTDFRVALEIDDLWRSEVGDYEKILATIYKLFGEEALDDVEHHEEIFNLAIKYLRCGKDDEDLQNDKEPSMDFKQDMGRIIASFRSDFQVELDKEEMHFWKFMDYLQGLKEDCALNVARMVREKDLKGMKGEERQYWIEAKKQVALKKEKTAREKELDKLWEERMRKE